MDNLCILHFSAIHDNPSHSRAIFSAREGWRTRIHHQKALLGLVDKGFVRMAADLDTAELGHQTLPIVADLPQQSPIDEVKILLHLRSKGKAVIIVTETELQ